MADSRIGSTIDGRFRIERLLGAGGMGKVYAATQLSVGHTVAIKLLRSDLSELHTSSQRFFREAQVMAALRHPNIVGLIDYGADHDTGALYIVMEYVDGRSLTDLLTRGRIPLSLALQICRQMCSGLAQAHAAGIVHRDLKPDNVMLELTAEGRVNAKLLDFGIALPQGPDETRFTATGGTLGTPRYMSPEQAQDGSITGQSDFYALGVILYEMIAGEPPFQADTPLAVLFKTVHERHTPITDVMQGIELPPSPVSGLIDDLLAKDPAERPADAMVLGQRLDELIAQVPTPPIVDSLTTLDTIAHPAVPIPREAGLDAPRSTAQDDDPNPVMDVPATSNRSLGPLIALGVFLIGAIVVTAAAAGAIFWATMSSDDPPDPPTITTAEPIAPTPAVPPPVTTEPPEPPQFDPPKVEPPEVEPQPEQKKEKKPKKTKKKPKSAKKPKKRPKSQATEKEHFACQRRKCTVDLKTKGASAVCQANATCDIDCPAGGCRQSCMGATCTFRCSGGGCTQACFSNSTCTFSCRGGGCDHGIMQGDVELLD